MSEEVDELVTWLATLLRTASPGPGGRPTWLDGAEITTSLEPASQRVVIKCEDGSRFFIPVLGVEMSRARREELERERQRQEEERRAAELADPGLKQKRIEMGRGMAETFRALHEERHRGRFETCRQEPCDTARPLIASMTEGDQTPDDESEFLN